MHERSVGAYVEPGARRVHGERLHRFDAVRVSASGDEGRQQATRTALGVEDASGRAAERCNDDIVPRAEVGAGPSLADLAEGAFAREDRDGLKILDAGAE